MKIGEIAKKTGLVGSTIRFYEEEGLLPPVMRGSNGYRDYPESALKRLDMVRKVQKMGFSLDVIRSMFLEGGGCSKGKTLEQVTLRLRDVDELAEAIAAQRVDLLALRAFLETSIQSGKEAPCPTLVSA